MSTQHTWEEVKHYYQIGTRPYMKGHNLNGGDVTIYEEGSLPRLRHIEDMFQDEALQLYESSGHVWNENSASDFYNHPMDWYSRNRIRKDFPEWTANEFHFLLMRGFDLFGLIESGQAIRKEKEA